MIHELMLDLAIIECLSKSSLALLETGFKGT